MGNELIVRRLRQVQRLLYIAGILAAALCVLHLFTYPYGNHSSIVSHGNVGLVSLTNGSRASNNSKLADSDFIHYRKNDKDNALSSSGMRQMESPIEIKQRDSNQESTLERVENLDYWRNAKKGQYGGKMYTSMAMNLSLVDSNETNISMEISSLVSTDISVMANIPELRKRRAEAMQLSAAQMDSLLINRNQVISLKLQ